MGYAQLMDLILSSLVGEESATYHWPYVFKEQGYEIIDTISLVCHETAELRHSLDYILNDYDIYNYESMNMVCKRYNKVIEDFRKSHVGCFSASTWGRPSTHLLRHILQQCYNRTVDDPELLNQYEPFSAEVYGETSFELVDQMIKTIKFSENDRFIDLGSGVGQVVMQVAAATHCKSCYGIEKAFWPAKYAKEMSSEFQKWLKFFGKTCGDFNLIKGNFLDEIHKDIISSATVIFVNNFAFGPQVDYELKQRFSNLKEGTKIVSSKAFCALNMQISERNLSDIGAILTVEELSPLRGPVSWTPKQVTYYLHTVDRSLLEEYFRRRQKPFYKGSQLVSRSRKERNQVGGETSGSDSQTKTEIISRRNHRKKSLLRPPTLNMVSTITASISPRFYPSATDTNHHYPSAQALIFDGHLPINNKSCLSKSKINPILADDELRVLNKMGDARNERTSQWLLENNLSDANNDIDIFNQPSQTSNNVFEKYKANFKSNKKYKDQNIFDICAPSTISQDSKNFDFDAKLSEISETDNSQTSSLKNQNNWLTSNDYYSDLKPVINLQRINENGSTNFHKNIFSSFEQVNNKNCTNINESFKLKSRMNRKLQRLKVHLNAADSPGRYTSPENSVKSYSSTTSTKSKCRTSSKYKNPFTGLSSEDDDHLCEGETDIDNILEQFYNETKKITLQDDYKSKDIYNDPILLQSSLNFTYPPNATDFTTPNKHLSVNENFVTPKNDNCAILTDSENKIDLDKEISPIIPIESHIYAQNDRDNAEDFLLQPLKKISSISLNSSNSKDLFLSSTIKSEVNGDDQLNLFKIGVSLPSLDQLASPQQNLDDHYHIVEEKDDMLSPIHQAIFDDEENEMTSSKIMPELNIASIQSGSHTVLDSWYISPIKNESGLVQNISGSHQMKVNTGQVYNDLNVSSISNTYLSSNNQGLNSCDFIKTAISIDLSQNNNSINNVNKSLDQTFFEEMESLNDNCKNEATESDISRISSKNFIEDEEDDERLNKMLDIVKSVYKRMLRQIKKPDYKEQLQQEIKIEQNRRLKFEQKAAFLEHQIIQLHRQNQVMLDTLEYQRSVQQQQEIMIAKSCMKDDKIASPPSFFNNGICHQSDQTILDQNIDPFPDLDMPLLMPETLTTKMIDESVTACEQLLTAEPPGLFDASGIYVGDLQQNTSELNYLTTTPLRTKPIVARVESIKKLETPICQKNTMCFSPISSCGSPDIIDLRQSNQQQNYVNMNNPTLSQSDNIYSNILDPNLNESNKLSVSTNRKCLFSPGRDVDNDSKYNFGVFQSNDSNVEKDPSRKRKSSDLEQRQDVSDNYNTSFIFKSDINNDQRKGLNGLLSTKKQGITDRGKATIFRRGMEESKSNESKNEGCNGGDNKQILRLNDRSDSRDSGLGKEFDSDRRLFLQNNIAPRVPSIDTFTDNIDFSTEDKYPERPITDCINIFSNKRTPCSVKMKQNPHRTSKNNVHDSAAFDWFVNMSAMYGQSPGLPFNSKSFESIDPFSNVAMNICRFRENFEQLAQQALTAAHWQKLYRERKEFQLGISNFVSPSRSNYNGISENSNFANS